MKKPPENRKKKQFDAYARYSTMVIQMGVIIGGGAYLGVVIDDLIPMEFPLFTIILSLFATFAALYLVYRQVTKIQKENEEDSD